MSCKRRMHTSAVLHVLLIALGWISIPLYLWEGYNHKKSIEQFGEALIAADAGIWFWNLETNELVWDDQMFVLFGRIREHWSPDYGGFESTLHPEDKDRVNAQVLKAIEQRGGYHDIFRIITASGEVREIRASAKVSRDGKYMTGINLPAISTPGNFKYTKSTIRSRSLNTAPVPGSEGPAPLVIMKDQSIILDPKAVIQN